MTLALKNTIPSGDSIPLNLGITNDITVRFKKSYWGVYEKYGVMCKAEKTRFNKQGLVGGAISENQPALYLKDNQRPLIIAGKAQINGDALLPQQGIRPGNISGNSYNHSQLVYGKIGNSTSALPKLDASLIQNLNQLARGQFPEISGIAISIKKHGVWSNSFSAPTKIIRGDDITLTETSLTGNIVVIASKRITVASSSQLTDVLLLAPQIKINNGVKGTFQAIANTTIQLGKNCELYYPSALVIKKNTPDRLATNSLRKPELFVDSDSYISGLLLYLNNSNEQLFYPQIKISTGAVVTGEIYCEQNLELKGRLNGRVITNTFIAQENGNLYQNHFFQGSIDNSALPKQYAGLIFQTEEIKTIGKWLY